MPGYPLGNYGSSYPYGSLLLGVSGFDERAFASDPNDLMGTGFGEVNARRLRYAIFWALYENNIFRRIHRWAESLKEKFDLYAAIRSIYSPAYRMGEFWAGHIWGGILDPTAGDGVTRASCLPIVIPESVPANLHGPIRAAIAQVWGNGNSNWLASKDLAARLGAVCGDVALAVVDDPGRQKVYLRVVHPRSICDLSKDAYGNCKGYRLEELRPDPRPDAVRQRGGSRGLVLYAETAEKVAERVVFRTYLGEDLYDWRDYPDGTPDDLKPGAEWTEDYGFVPLFHIQHRDMGLGFGWSEFQPALSKILEVEDQASKGCDQIRKIVDPEWFYAGVSGPDELDLRDAGPDDGDPSDSPRNVTPAIYCRDPNGTATPLVAPLDIAAWAAHVHGLLAELERDHPELQADMATSSGDASGRALRVARERVEAMVAQRRVGYDDALVRAHKACLSIGGMKGYPGFEAFNAESFGLGYLDHSIGDRPVFAVDEMDRLEERKARADVLAALVAAGMPTDLAMEEAGYSKESVDRQRAAMRTREVQRASMVLAGDGAGTFNGIGQ